MSTPFSEELVTLRSELRAPQERVSLLEQQAVEPRSDGGPATVVPVTVNYHPSQTTDSPVVTRSSVQIGSPSQAPELPVGTTPSGRVSATLYTEDYRREITLGIGDYFRRCLQGHRVVRR